LQRQAVAERQQLEASELRREAARFDWMSVASWSSLINRVSPHHLQLYRHLQSSLASSAHWLDATRYTASSSSLSSRSSSSSDQRQGALIAAGRLARRPDPHAIHIPRLDPPRTITEKLNGSNGRNSNQQNPTAAKWSARVAKYPKYAPSGALDLSLRRSAVGRQTDTFALETTLSKEEKQGADGEGMWMPVMDLKSSLAKIVNQDVEKPAKQIACPVCYKVFNAHYNLTRHMPVHTGARPFICKVRTVCICQLLVRAQFTLKPIYMYSLYAFS